jgi:2'-5' RNA ligase
MNYPPEERTARVFFALWPEDAERAALAAWQQPLSALCGGRAMCADTLHVTLVFLGDVVRHRLEAVSLAAEEVRGTCFDLTFDHARYWNHNHVVYAEPCSVPPQLAQLVGDLRQRLYMHRFHFDSQAYKPHVTLLRHGKWSDAPLPGMAEVTWQVRGFALLQSARGARGASYSVLARIPFAVA